MGPVTTIARLGERVGREDCCPLCDDRGVDASRGVCVIDVAVVDDLITAITEEPEVFEALGAGHWRSSIRAGVVVTA